MNSPTAGSVSLVNHCSPHRAAGQDNVSSRLRQDLPLPPSTPPPPPRWRAPPTTASPPTISMDNQQHQPQAAGGSSGGTDTRPSFTTFWKRSREVLSPSSSPRKITFVPPEDGSGSGRGHQRGSRSLSSTAAAAAAGVGGGGDGGGWILSCFLPFLFLLFRFLIRGRSVSPDWTSGPCRFSISYPDGELTR